ncbi:hypothetical protein Zmor_015588 [Zophobas morio]|uniref:Cytochrome P450 n=1 Tax=Zophobas morio TaxID=2755281 RepID=A0AA38ILV1_9CUCU|nr:hypothetical protein Zmor_015588 [Zophobas morio]
MSSVTELLCIFILIFLLTWYLYYLYCFNYWKRKKVPSATPLFPTGHILKPILGKENIFVTTANHYKEFKSKGYKHAGLYFFNGPVYLPIDPAIVKSILTTDFEHFVDRGTFVDEINSPLTGNLFSLKGLKWKSLRSKLSPTFSSGKLKTMYEIFMKMTQNFVSTVEQTARKDGEVNIKYISSNFTVDLIFSTAFGLEGDTLQKPDGKLSQTTKTFFTVSTWEFFKNVVLDGFQNPGNIVRGVYGKKSLESFFMELVTNTIKHRSEQKIIRRDFMALLLEVRDKEGLSFNEILAQCFLFFLAGFETSSQTISYCIHELAHNQDIQNKLREEIFNNLGKDFTKYSYEDIFKLPYLDQVFNETLRLYPVLGFFNRMCVKPYKVPSTDVVIEKGTPVLIPVLGLQRDPEYFPDPMRFDPERFREGQLHVPCTFLPFGEGPRFCIGMRYGKLQTKLGIAALVSRFRFSPSSTTARHVEFDKFCKALVMVPEEGINVKVEEL